jgi:hypothetical protein
MKNASIVGEASIASLNGDIHTCDAKMKAIAYLPQIKMLVVMW